jgi:hypothetical protein
MTKTFKHKFYGWLFPPADDGGPAQPFNIRHGLDGGVHEFSYGMSMWDVEANAGAAQ